MSGREFYENTSTIKAYRKARFWHDYNKIETKRRIAANIIQKNRPYVKTRLKNAILNEKITRRNLNKPIEVEPTYIVSRGLTKFLISVMVLMAFLTLNIVGKLDTITLDKINSTTKINYTQNYKDLTYDYPNDIMYVQRLENIGKSFEIFGKNTIWFTQINKYASENGKITTTIQFIGNILLLPVNLIINVFQLGTNVVNSAIGNETFNSWNLRYYGELTPETVHKWEQFSKYLPWNWFN